MNFVFFSPHFPSTGTEFCDRLKKAGATVLGIGDAPYDSLDPCLKAALSEYYRIPDMDNYDQTYRAMGHFIHKWGRIDRFESLNEHWLDLEAGIRTDFNIWGIRLDYVQNIKKKSRMRAAFRKAGVNVIAQKKTSERTGALDFISRVGYPIVVKPDSGAGAAHTYKISTPEELDEFFRIKPEGVSFVMEEFIDGLVGTFDGLVNRDGEIVFAASTRYDDSIMDVVNNNKHMSYTCLPEIELAVEEAGRKIVEAFDLKERFFHIELFETKAGKIIALEVNIRPPGGYMTDAINYSFDIDIYAEWANMVVKNQVGGPFKGKYYTAYASRKDHIRYLHSHGDVLAAHGDKIVRHNSIEKIFSRAMGNYAYQLRSTDSKALRHAVEYIQATEA
ncbi:ATP-grasp domain-containing protein [Methylovirgula sp. 4M-Z18]|uniref:ATP-grasp domain-containing protein n=1 Tax=Methylovirgula sp. 4M-Z18 TaxID=2293567 RepID=UPI000E2FAB54|nr:ATP-grasp domain-containing protein [Methylovirgula sp. 4M-Z18]RFB80723.1 ATP-grasp domain-containing protein [Methylovirgula sp. 4M-Z18]